MSTVMRLVYLDSGVLIAAARGKDVISEAALAVLESATFEFASSALVKLEVIPKAQYYQRSAEVSFYEAFFSRVSTWVEVDSNLVQLAYAEAKRAGLSAIDALHIAAAVVSGAERLITSETNEKPIHRTTLIPVQSIHRTST